MHVIMIRLAPHDALSICLVMAFVRKVGVCMCVCFRPQAIKTMLMIRVENCPDIFYGKCIDFSIDNVLVNLSGQI